MNTRTCGSGGRPFRAAGRLLLVLLASVAVLAGRPAQDTEPRIVFEQPVDGGYISGPTSVSIRIVPPGRP